MVWSKSTNGSSAFLWRCRIIIMHWCAVTYSKDQHFLRSALTTEGKEEEETNREGVGQLFLFLSQLIINSIPKTQEWEAGRRSSFHTTFLQFTHFHSYCQDFICTPTQEAMLMSGLPILNMWIHNTDQRLSNPNNQQCSTTHRPDQPKNKGRDSQFKGKISRKVRTLALFKN